MKSRKTIELGERFNKRWLCYAAAGAALTMPGVANADIIATHTDLTFSLIAPGEGWGSGIRFMAPLTSVDLNHDGINDFQLWGSGSYGLDGGRVALRFVGNGGAGVVSNAAALLKGSPVGPRAAFRDSAAMVGAVYHFYQPYRNSISGPWRGSVRSSGACSRYSGFCAKDGNVADAYLGLRFYINGEAHYGWAELSLSTVAKPGEASLDGEITAYAYDTIPNQGLDAGQTSDTPEPGTLGLLGLGSLGLGLWRRRKALSGRW